MPSGSVVVYGDLELNFLRTDINNTNIKVGPYSIPEDKTKFLKRVKRLGTGKVYLDVENTRVELKRRAFEPAIVIFLNQYRYSPEAFVPIGEN